MAFDIIRNTSELDRDLLLSQFFETFGNNYTQSEKERFTLAWDFLYKKTSILTRTCGKPYYLHPMRVAAILAESKMDGECIVCGLLHSIFEIQGVTKEEVESLFGPVIARIVYDTSRITGMKINATSIQQADNIRKMLFAMIDDVRVILVKLADRLDRMRNLKSIDEKKQRLVASEVIDI